MLRPVGLLLRPMLDWLHAAPRHLFFTGKGGVGKTSLACASAIALADAGRRVLLVSTDPASNLDEVLGTALGAEPRAVAGMSTLFALNIDPLAAARAYRERLIEPYRASLPPALVRSMEEQLSGACTTEIAAFDEFCKLLGHPERTAGYDHVVFDTAPTGHTLRLLALPRAWSEFMASNTSGTSCLGPLSGLQAQEAIYRAALAELKNPERTVVALVSRPQVPPLREAQRTSDELAAEGVGRQRILLNGVFRPASAGDEIALNMERRETAARAAYSAFLARHPVDEIPLQRHNLLGIAALRALARGQDHASPVDESPDLAPALPTDLNGLVDDLAAAGHGVILVMGKGGVGKTTLAAAIACALARRGHNVTLSTTDPAAHVHHAVDVASVRVTAIDPARETAAYRAEVLASAGRDLDADGRALLEEDLRSPCTEEIAVFRAFARTVAEGASGFVVLDTAPTGHTLLLLDATEAYHREVARHGNTLPDAVRDLLPRLRDPAFTRVLIAALPEATPVHEAAQLQDDLRRAGIEPYAWLINQSLLLADTRDPLLVARGRREAACIREVVDSLHRRVILLPWLAREPVGTVGLAQFVPSTRLETAP
jgi:arsenite-transporting ATPase